MQCCEQKITLSAKSVAKIYALFPNTNKTKSATVFPFWTYAICIDIYMINLMCPTYLKFAVCSPQAGFLAKLFSKQKVRKSQPIVQTLQTCVLTYTFP